MVKKKELSQDELTQKRFDAALDFVIILSDKLVEAISLAAGMKEPRKRLPKLMKLLNDVMADLEALEDDFSTMYKEFIGDVEFVGETVTRVI